MCTPASSRRGSRLPSSSSRVRWTARIDADDSPLPPHVVATLAERAGGNPLFLGELLAAARSEGVDALPDTLEALLANQIDHLGTRDRAVLRVASVLGASFSPDILAESLDASGYSLDDATWQRLAGFVHVDSHGTARFRHALIRDAAYEGLPYRRRLELHARVGETIERVAGATPDEQAELLSLHFLHAHLFDKAWHYARVAGERARAVYANVEAAEFFGRALQAARRLDDVDPLEVAAVWEALGDAYDRAGVHVSGASAYRSARRLRAGDHMAAARLCLKMAWMEDRLGNFPQTLRWVQRGLKAIEGMTGREAAAQRAQLKVFYGAVRQGQGRSREAIRWCTEGIEEARRAGEKKALAHAYTILDWADIALGRPAEATRSLAALALYEELGDLDGQALILNNTGAWAYFEGRWDDALELYERARVARERLGDVVVGAEIAYNVAEILVDRGQLTEAEEIVQRSLRIWRSSGQRPSVAYALRLLGRIESRLGRSEEGIQLLFQAREEFRELGAQAEMIETDARIAGSLARQGRSEGALQLATEALDGAPGPVAPLLQRTVGFALAQLGDADGALAAFLRSLASARAQRAQYEEAITLDALVHLCERTDDPAGEGFREERDTIFEALGVVYVPPVPLGAVDPVR
jgi:tetratricopeptide (TPR) repeat protein